MTYFLQLLVLVVVVLVVEASASWYAVSVLPVPKSYLDIQHKADYEKLTHILFPTIKAALERDGDVAQPIAFGIEVSDQLDFLNAQGHSTLDSLQMIVHDFKEGAHNGQYRSLAIAYDTTRHELERAPFDAIEFRFEHIDGEALHGWFEYKKRAPHVYWYGPMHYLQGKLEVFTHQNIVYGDGN